MRFTVHDSPDYYQLKVSVFNDDKKTELIGETWVALDTIVIPGGGQNDLWHPLNCKGRFAGEIRIELTYYDTRPKEEKMDENRRQSSASNLQEQSKETASGPRQPKSVKRRPLPADPTQPPATHPALIDQPQYPTASYTPPTSKHNISIDQPSHMNQLASVENHSPTQYSLNDSSGERAYVQNHLPVWHEALNQDRGVERPQNYERDHCPPYDSPAKELHCEPYQLSDRQMYRSEDLYPSSLVQNNHGLYDAGYSPSPPGMPQQHSMPDIRPHPVLQNSGGQPSHRNSLPTNRLFETSQRESAVGPDMGSWSSPNRHVRDEEGPPPPPPAHRSSGLRSPQDEERRYADIYQPIQAPAPLKGRVHRGSASGSPLSQALNNPSPNGHLSTSPSNSQPLIHSGGSISSRTSRHSQPNRMQSQNNLLSSVRDHELALPPSLVPGYEPSVAEDESRRLIEKKRMSTRHHLVNEPAVSYTAINPHQPQPESVQPYQVLPSRGIYPESRPHPQSHSSRRPHAETYPPVGDNHTPEHQQRLVRELGASPSSGHTMQSSAVAPPDPRTPTRKSVSPAPEPTSGERRTSAVPFSPDSYESFNPSLSAASSINAPGAKYQNPEQAREAFREHEKESRLSEGPIVGSDGRVIDPSDHLPVDTWAPEPEQKQPRKGPEVTVRFRHHLQGAQPMPSTPRRPLHDTSARAHSATTPIYAHSPDSVSTSPASVVVRSRLQKKSRVSPSQPMSSPAVPTLHTDSSRSALPHPSISEHSFPKYETGGYNSDRPMYGNECMNDGIAPPVPRKIPMHPVEENRDMSALSEEMRRIDIGVGGGQGRWRRSRLGI